MQTLLKHQLLNTLTTAGPKCGGKMESGTLLSDSVQAFNIALKDVNSSINLDGSSTLERIVKDETAFISAQLVDESEDRKIDRNQRPLHSEIDHSKGKNLRIQEALSILGDARSYAEVFYIPGESGNFDDSSPLMSADVKVELGIIDDIKNVFIDQNLHTNFDAFASLINNQPYDLQYFSTDEQKIFLTHHYSTELLRHIVLAIIKSSDAKAVDQGGEANTAVNLALKKTMQVSTQEDISIFGFDPILDEGTTIDHMQAYLRTEPNRTEVNRDRGNPNNINTASYQIGNNKWLMKIVTEFYRDELVDETLLIKENRIQPKFIIDGVSRDVFDKNVFFLVEGAIGQGAILESTIPSISRKLSEFGVVADAVTVESQRTNNLDDNNHCTVSASSNSPNAIAHRLYDMSKVMDFPFRGLFQNVQFDERRGGDREVISVYVSNDIADNMDMRFIAAKPSILELLGRYQADLSKDLLTHGFDQHSLSFDLGAEGGHRDDMAADLESEEQCQNHSTQQFDMIILSDDAPLDLLL